jgi:hypothetical protein
MYIPAKHDHVQWLLTKKEKQAQFEAKKKDPKPIKTKADNETKSTNKSNKDKKHLKLSDAVASGLTTKVMIGNSNARALAKRWFAQVNANNTNESSDDSGID